MIPLPEEFKLIIEKMLGDEAPAFFASLEEKATLALRVNPSKAAAHEAAQPYAEDSVPWEKSGYYLKDDVKPGAGIAHAAGAFYLQEASAMLSVAVMQPQPGERILDLCAAPGGKSSQIAGYMQNKGLLISNEPEPARCRVLSSNLERMGTLHAAVVNAYPDGLSAHWQEEFDAILCDAPCSGEGMFRRDKNARLEWKPGSPAGCAKRQAEILDQAAKMLKKGGRLIYSTCTFNPDENENTISAFLERHPDFHFEDFEIEGIGRSTNGCMRIFPHRQRGDGHFAAKLRKDGEAKKTAPVPN
ncbi:MAG: RsmB/NOP family class I SAM-dependent RNA methyltransferase, partial [Clostridia bacterium]|nr:RsmB/NOP family class I SAM-dependent RNA methyltransferase [Clostridia bacterium]